MCTHSNRATTRKRYGFALIQVFVVVAFISVGVLAYVRLQPPMLTVSASHPQPSWPLPLEPQPTITPALLVLRSPQVPPKPTPDPVVMRELHRLQHADPAVDVQHAWQQGDLRFIGIDGAVSGQVLGVKDGSWNPLVQRYGFDTIPGTGDYLGSREQAQLQQIATRYATRYNQFLANKLEAPKR